MAIFAVAPKEYPQAPEGPHHCVVVDVIDRGLEKSTQEGWRDRLVVEIRLQTAALAEDGTRYLVCHKMTNSLGAKAKLRGFVEASLGRKLTKAELTPNGLNLEGLTGKNVQASIVHTLSEKTNRIYANADSVMPTMPHLPVLKPEDYTREQDRGSSAT